MRAVKIFAGLAAAALAASAGQAGTAPAETGVKAGADAWSRGDYAGAISQWQVPAAAGDPDAQFNLGQAYRLGRGVDRDLGRAEELFGKAAAQGHVQAADNYGLLMFDRGARAQAMPYVRAAADRGDPRAQYLLGIAHFNGDLAPKDWVRAYALMTLAQSAGLPQAAPAMQQMDGYIPLAQRQQAASMAQEIGQRANTARAAQIAAADLGGASSGSSARLAPALPAAPAGLPAGLHAGVPAAAPARPVATVADASPATAGADYARPATPQAPPLASRTRAPAPVTPLPAPASRPVAPKPATPALAAAPSTRPAASGPWRVQLGAFGVAANADALWAKAAGRPELASHPRINVRAGKVSKLQAGGFATRDAAGAACATLGRAGYTCLPVQD